MLQSLDICRVKDIHKDKKNKNKVNFRECVSIHVGIKI